MTNAVLTIKDGASTDMVLSFGPVRDSLKVAFTTATVEFSIQRLDDDLYWDDVAGDFDDVAEPALLTAPHIRDGIYTFDLTTAYVAGKNRYRIHVTITGLSPTIQDYGFDVIIGMDGVDISSDVWDAARANHLVAGSFGEYTPASLERIKGLTTVDGIDVGVMFENFIAALQGSVDRPGAANVYEHLKQDGSTIAFTLTTSAIGRVAT